jgi:hypothetical protein
MNKLIIIYYRENHKLVKEQLFARDKIPLDNSLAPLSRILLSLKIRKEKIPKPNNYLKII